MDTVSYKFKIVVTSVRERTEESIHCGLEQSETLFKKTFNNYGENAKI